VSKKAERLPIYDSRSLCYVCPHPAFKGLMKLPPYFWDVMMDALSEKEE
jgi:hypothetical protein